MSDERGTTGSGAPSVPRILAASGFAGLACVAAFVTLDPAVAPTAALAGVCLALWLTEAVPAFVPTLVLIALAPLATGLPASAALRSMADPVLVLFFGGFALGEAASTHGIDRRVVAASIRAAGGSAVPLVGIVLLSTALLSMWISNVAAAALMLAALKPALDGRTARPLLLAVALGANLGGMATPIGTGPNAIAIATMAAPPSFLSWMALALPLTLSALVAGFAWVVFAHRVGGAVEPPPASAPSAGERPGAVAAVAALAIALWLSESLHGVPAAVVSAGLAAVLFATGLLSPDRLGRLDWSTLVLIAGGIGLGGLLEHAGLVDRLADSILSADAPRLVVLGALLFATAGLSALMSNTATATLLVPVAAALLPDTAGAPILVALAASFGMPFVVSTPANAMAVGAGAKPSDLLWPGLFLMVGGCLVLTLTGPWVLALLG